jgi:hypothetical protein
MNASPAIGIAQAQFTNHAAARAAGSDPGAATSPRCRYRQQRTQSVHQARPQEDPADPAAGPGR